MKNIKKYLALGASLVLTAALAVAGTLAYFTWEDSDVNVMTVGNVQIEQLEYERVVENNNWVSATEKDKYGYYPDKLQEYSQNKPLYPAVFADGKIKWDDRNGSQAASGTGSHQQSWAQIGASGSNQLFDDSVKNAQDKFVFVKNTGKNDAYVRTWFAFEQGNVSAQDFKKIIALNTNDKNGESGSGHWAWETVAADVEIDGNTYVVMCATYLGAKSTQGTDAEGILAPSVVTYPSLLQVYMKPEATNEDVEAIDGNGNGTYDIMVLSQAVQAAGFDKAENALNAGFGEINVENLKEWFDGIVVPVGYQVSNDAELSAAIQAGETQIWLNAGTYHAPAAAKGKTLTLNGTKDSVIEVVPAGQGEANGQLDYNFDGSTVTFNGVTIKTNSKTYAGYARLSGTYNNCVIQNTYNLGVGTSEFNDCAFNISNEYLRVGGAHSAEFNRCTFNTAGRAILVFQDGTTNNQTVIVKDCVFNADAAAYTWDKIHVAAVSIDGSQGGTYNVTFEGNNTVDTDFAGLCQIKKQKDSNVTITGATATELTYKQ